MIHRVFRAVVAVALCLLASAATAHDLTVVSTRIVLDGTALTLGVSLPEEDAERLGGEPVAAIADGASLMRDGMAVPMQLSGSSRADGILSMTLRGTVAAPQGAAELRLALPPSLGPAIIDVRLPGGGSAVAASGEAVVFDLAADQRSAFLGWLATGFAHVLPEGPDHILFVLGLFLLAPGWRQLLGLVTCFTLAHSVTLALALGGLIPALPHVVEPLIALSIAIVGIEALLASGMRPWRWALVGGFGLVHGMGFAGSLSDGLPAEGTAVALAGFNLGIELAQVAIVGVAVALTAWCRDRRWFRPAVAMPAAAAIALTGLWWAIERVAA